MGEDYDSNVNESIWGGQGAQNPFQQYANAYDQQGQAGFENLDHNELVNNYQQFAQQATPQQLYQAHQQYYEQMPQPQRQGLLSGLLGAFGQQGINPQQVGFQGQNPYQATPQNLATATQYATRNPDILSSIMGPGGALSSPLAKMALAGGLAFAAKSFLGGGNNGTNSGFSI